MSTRNLLGFAERARAAYLGSDAARLDAVADAECTRGARINELRRALFNHGDIPRERAASAASPHALLDAAAKERDTMLIIALVEVAINRRDSTLAEAGARYFDDRGVGGGITDGGETYRSAPNPTAGWIRELSALTLA